MGTTAVREVGRAAGIPASPEPGTAFQDRMAHNACFGCGADNPAGLRLRSAWQGDEAVAVFQPAAHHAAGPPHVTNGGIIATVIDCHAVCTALADAYRREGRPIGAEPEIWFATTSLTVKYLRPTPIEGPAVLRARVVGVGPQRTTLQVTLEAGGTERVWAEVVAARVPPGWRRPAAQPGARPGRGHLALAPPPAGGGSAAAAGPEPDQLSMAKRLGGWMGLLALGLVGWAADRWPGARPPGDLAGPGAGRPPQEPAWPGIAAHGFGGVCD